MSYKLFLAGCPGARRLALSMACMVLLGLVFMGFGGQTARAANTPSVASTTPVATRVTTITIGNTVQRSSVKRFGINLGGQSFYDSGQLLRNLTFRNPGFEGEIWQSILLCHSATGNSCTDDDPWNQWPADFLTGAKVEFISGAARGETGTVTGMQAANPNAQTGITVSFSALNHAPAAGDYYIVRKAMPGNAQAGWWPSTNGGGILSTEFTDLSAKSPGKQALRMTAGQQGQSAAVVSYFDTVQGHSFLQLNGRYTLSFRAKGLGGANRLDVAVTRLGTSRGNLNYLDQSVPLSGNWQDYSFPFSASENGNSIGTVGLFFAANGSSALLDDVQLVEAAAPDNPTMFRNAVVQKLRALHPGVLRYGDNQAEYGSTIDNLLAVDFARVRAGNSERIAEQDDIPIGYHEFLQLCRTVGAEPWLTVPAVTTPGEMQNLIEYLGGDASTRYGQLRASLGQAAPWTTVFSTIHLEFGNETWNVVSFPGEKMNDPVAYAMRTGTVFGAAKTAPGYLASKFDLIMDGWAAVPWWNQQELASSSNVDTIDAAPYLFNNLSDYRSQEAIFGPLFAQPEQVDSTAGGYMAQQAKTAASAPKPVKLAVYEVNLSTLQGTAPQNVLDGTVASVGAGIGLLDHMFTMLRDDGVVTQNVFALTEYENGFTNTANTGANENVKLWGTVVDMGGQTNRVRPQFLAEQLANTALFGHLVKSVHTGADPVWNQSKSANDQVVLAKAHYLQSFAFVSGSKHSLVLFNLHRSAALPVKFAGTNAPTGQVKVQELRSNHITDTNEQRNTVAIKSSTVNTFHPQMAFSLPPYSMTVLTWSAK